MNERRTKRKGTEERAYFSFLRSYAEQADALEGLDKLEFLEAIISAGLNNVKPTFTDGKVSAKLKAGLFAGVRPTIEKGWIKFNAGGAPQKERNASTDKAEEKQSKSETPGIKDKGEKDKGRKEKKTKDNQQEKEAFENEDISFPPANFSDFAAPLIKGCDQLPTLSEIEAFIDVEGIGEFVEAGEILERIQTLKKPQAWRRYVEKVAEGRRNDSASNDSVPAPYYQDVPQDE